MLDAHTVGVVQLSRSFYANICAIFCRRDHQLKHQIYLRALHARQTFEYNMYTYTILVRLCRRMQTQVAYSSALSIAYYPPSTGVHREAAVASLMQPLTWQIRGSRERL